MNVPPVGGDPGPVVDPKIEADSPVEPPQKDKEPPVVEKDEPEQLARKAGGAQTTALNFQIPTQPQATVDQSTGALVYEYPIELPAGRAGMTPELTLRYNSRNVTKPDSIAGLGWEISIPYIQREPIRGTQSLYTKPFFSSSISKGNLVATTDASSNPYATYRPESDDGDYLKYAFTSGNTWTATGKDGRTYTFGGTSASRQDDPGDSSKVYRWMVSKIADSHGNEIQYSYTKDQGQIYPSQIVYTYHASSPAVHTVSFAYTTPANYGSTVYNAAFPVVTAQLLSTITVSTTIDSQSTTHTYNFSYSDAQSLKQKLLDSIEHVTSFPAVEYNQTFNDTTTFTYSTKAPGWEQGTHSLAGYLNFQDDNIFKDIYTADFDLNGYPDVFVSYHFRSTNDNYLLLNSGTQFTDATASWSLPTNVDLSSEYVIADLNGDHLPDFEPRFFSAGQTPPIYLNTGSGFTPDYSGTWFIANYAPEASNCGPNVGDAKSYNTNTFLYDINRDGKNDIVYFGGPQNFKVYLNNGHGWTQSNDYTFTIAPGPDHDFSRNCTTQNGNWQALIDVNGDGLEDYVHEQFGTYLNTGSGFAYSAAYSLNTEEMARSGLADINGDGLIDLIEFRTYDGGNRCSLVRMNNGAGWTMANPTTFPPCANSNVWTPYDLMYGSNNPEAFGTLMDVTADGLPDIVGALSQSVTGRVRAINDGRNAWAENSTYQDPWAPVITPAYGVFFDINTDGILDFITPLDTWDHQPQAASKVYMGKPSVPNRLVQITSTLGAQIAVEYGTAPTNYSDTNVSPMPVVKKITVQNIGQNQPTMVVQYAYAGGAYVADPATKQRRFAGFHKVTATESGSDLSALRVTDTYFHQANGSDSATGEPEDASFALIGRPYYSVVQHPSGTPKKETWQHYGTYTLTTEPTIGRLSQFAYPTETIVKTTEPSATTGTAEVYTYDTTLGERTELRSLGFVTVGSGGSYTDIPGDTRYQFTEYAANASSTIVKPSRVDIRTSPSPSGTISRTDYFYDGQAYGTIGSFGDLTKESRWISGNGATAAATIHTYDAFGNVLTMMNPRGATTTYTYDSSHSLVATETNHLNQTTSYQYITGKLQQITGPNNRITTYGYSSKGWLYRTTVANTAGNKRTLQFLDGSFQPGDWKIETDSQLVDGHEDRSWQLFDNLGRPVHTVRERLNHTTGATGGYYLKESRGYDPLGRETVRTAPLGTPNFVGPSYAAEMPVPTALVSTTTYDLFDRPLSIANALGTATLAYAGSETTTTDANGKTKRTKTDAYGNLIEVMEYNGTSTYTTRYGYDARNLLTGVTDALGNIRSFTYNNAGWLTTSEDLHAPGDTSFGVTAFTYDLAGNQITETQPKGTVVTRAYDLLDRVTSIVDGTPVIPTNYTFTYDTCTKGLGRLCGVSGTFPNYGLTFAKSFVYGASLPSSMTMTTLGTTYTTGYEYTLSDEPSRITHPDGTVVRYTFGDWALPSAVYTKLPGGSETTFATALYHHTLQPETITIASGPTLSYLYDGEKLYRTASFSATTGTTTLQSYAYTYDNLNNVTQVAEPGLTKTYTYDDLYRLIQAVHTASAGTTSTYVSMCPGSSGGNMIFADGFESGDMSRWGSGSGLPGGQVLAQGVSYNAIGNITSSTCNNYTRTYTYSGIGKANPHAVTSIGSGLYTYDDNGNVITAPNQIIAYNWQNQIVSVTSGTTSTIFAYDETGKRFLYQTPATKEIQVSAEYLVRGGASEIVVKLGKTPIGLVTGGAIYSTINDHLGTPVKHVNASGAISESTSYGPFGSILSQTGTLDAKRGYTGHEEDADTGLVYAEARYYSPLSQRFFQQDPSHVYLGYQKFSGLIGIDRKLILLDPQQLNSYSYVRNNPVTLTDPSGKFLLAALELAAYLFFDPVSYANAPAPGQALKGGSTDVMERAAVGALGRDYDSMSTGGKLFVGFALQGFAGAAEGTGRLLTEVGDLGLSSEEISKRASQIADHAFNKHVLIKREYGSLFQGKAQFQEYIESVMKNPSDFASDGSRSLYWDDRLGSIIIENPENPTAFRPAEPMAGKKYFYNQREELLGRLRKKGNN